MVCGNFHVPWSIFEQHLPIATMTKELRIVATPWRSAALGRAQLIAANIDSRGSSALKWKNYEGFLIRVIFVKANIKLLLVGISLCGLILSAAIGSEFFREKSWIRGGFLMMSGVLFLMLCVSTMDLPSLIRMTLKQDVPIQPADEPIHALYSRQLRNPRDMAFGMWAVLERRASTQLYAHTISPP